MVDLDLELKLINGAIDAPLALNNLIRKKFGLSGDLFIVLSTQIVRSEFNKSRHLTIQYFDGCEKYKCEWDGKRFASANEVFPGIYITEILRHPEEYACVRGRGKQIRVVNMGCLSHSEQSECKKIRGMIEEYDLGQGVETHICPICGSGMVHGEYSLFWQCRSCTHMTSVTRKPPTKATSGRSDRLLIPA